MQESGQRICHHMSPSSWNPAIPLGPRRALGRFLKTADRKVYFGLPQPMFKQATSVLSSCRFIIKDDVDGGDDDEKDANEDTEPENDCRRFVMMLTKMTTMRIRWWFLFVMVMAFAHTSIDCKWVIYMIYLHAMSWAKRHFWWKFRV